ncbi:MAG: translation initiation factor IF-2 subunit alpha [Candidatus Altiarchaeota archaeon]
MSRDDYPEKGELVLGSVKSIFKQGAFIELEEYGNKNGMLHLSEISLKWVRNIRDYVKEGQKVVLMVLRIDPSRGHIDLSLRRVSDAARKQKLQDVKQRQRSLKFMEILSSELNVKPETVSKKVGSKLEKEYGSVYAGLEAISADHDVADGLGLDEKWRKALVALVSKSIKSPLVEITGYVELKSYESEGVNIIKDSLAEISKHSSKNCDVSVSYVSAPFYSVKVVAPDYKTAERTMKTTVEQGIKHLSSKGGEGTFYREIPKKK